MTNGTLYTELLTPSCTQLFSELTVLVHQQMTTRNCVCGYSHFMSAQSTLLKTWT